MDRDRSRKGSAGCGGCLCFALVLAVFATASPYWIWRSSWTCSWAYCSSSSTIASGSYVVSSSTTSVRYSPWTTYYIVPQWNYFDQFYNTEICSDATLTANSSSSFPTAICNSNYDCVGKYGFCPNGPNTTAETPAQISQIQGLMIATCVILFFATLAACAAPHHKGGSKSGFAALLLSLCATGTSCAAFAIATKYDWYQTFSHNTKGTGFLPFIATNNGQQVIKIYGPFSGDAYLWWGPAFWSTVAVFVICFFATISMGLVSKRLDDEDLDGGSYGAGSGASEYAYGNDYSIDKT